MAETNDIALLREYLDRNSETAFAGLVQRHVNLVYSVALRFTGNSHDAQDVTQTVFVILAKKAASLRQRTNLTGWLYETARFTSRQLLRTRARQQAREQEAYMQSTLNDSETESIWRQLAPLLEEAMSRLSEKERTLVALRFFENKTGAETAALTGLNEWAARKRIERAMDKLQKFFSKRGINSTTMAIAGAISANSIQAAPIALAKTATAIALAKGATASVSTLTIVKGALKIMAWTKMKMVAAVGITVALLAGTVIVAASRPAGTEFNGTLKLIFPNGHQTNNYDFQLLSKLPYWELSLTSSNRNHHVYSSPQRTFEVDIYDNPPTGALNTAYIKIFPGARPLSDREAEHIWLALLSQKTFLEQKLPLQDPGLGMVEPSTITDVSGTMDDISPRQMQWVNEFPAHRTTRIEGDFKWTASTNYNGLNIPLESQMSIYLVNSNGNQTLASFSELVIDSVVPSSRSPTEIPKIPGRNVIEDYRLNDFSKIGWFPKSKRYDVFDGKGLEKMPPNKELANSHLTATQRNLKLEQPSSHKWKWIWLVVILIVLVAVAIIGLIKRKQRH